jgi:hypothetical protein
MTHYNVTINFNRMQRLQCLTVMSVFFLSDVIPDWLQPGWSETSLPDPSLSLWDSMTLSQRFTSSQPSPGKDNLRRCCLGGKGEGKNHWTPAANCQTYFLLGVRCNTYYITEVAFYHFFWKGEALLLQDVRCTLGNRLLRIEYAFIVRLSTYKPTSVRYLLCICIRE